jgi:hypothetical protein
MRRIDTPTAAQDLFGPGKHGFRNGDPGNAVLATRLNAEHFNATQEEIAGVIEGAGAALNPADNGQLFAAIKSLFRSVTLKASEVLLGVLRVGTQAEVNAGTLDDVAVTPKKLRLGFAMSATANGYVIFPSWLGGITIQWGNVLSMPNDGNDATSAGVEQYINFATAFISSCFAVVAIHSGHAPSTGVIVRNVTKNSFTAENTSGTARAVLFIAIGN